MPIFQSPDLFSQSWELALITAVSVSLIVLIYHLIQLKPQWGGAYRSDVAWAIGGITFTAFYLISWLTGVLQTIFSRPIIQSEQLSTPAWWGLTLLCFIIIYVGYWTIWPMGTLTHGRQRNLGAILTFGTLWGVGEGLFFMSLLALVEKFGLSRLWTGIIAYLLIAAFKGIWHSQFWDIYVSPEHNIEEWNGRKVLFVHTPNLIFTLIYVLLYENVAIFVFLQTLALVGSAYFMHFPSYQAYKSTSLTP